MSRKVVAVTIRGRVQGVGYRAWLKEQADAHGIDGWVHNLNDGAVEALLAGPEPAVATLIDLCHAGPRGARVGTVDVMVAGWDGPAGFRILS
ncbi:MAG: acylphosphatase [Bauldia sp.]